MTKEKSQTAALVVFLGLVVATAGAFFVTQRLKRSKPIVKRLELPLYISPNGDGRKDRIEFGFFLPRRDRVTVSIVDAEGDEVRRVADDRRLRRGRHRFRWDGRDERGRVPPDGQYNLRFAVREQGRATTTRRGIRLLTKPPRPSLTKVAPQRLGLRPARRPPVTIEFTGPSSPSPVFSIYRTDADPPRLVRRFTGVRNEQTGSWDGRLQDGSPAPPGAYAVAVTVQNKGLVAGSAPRRLPPEVDSAAPDTGVTISGPTAAPPLEPVRAGQTARIALSGTAGRVRWSLRRLGSRRPLADGRARPPSVPVRIPSRARTGLHLVRLETRSGPVTVPLVVRGRRTGRVLVVLPSISWQGLNPVDTDADGFPDTLDSARSVAIARPFAKGAPPQGFGSQAALLRFLGDEGLPYDITTDLALARKTGPGLGGRPGVLFAGSERWLTEELDGRLRDYVEAGGKVASFGTDAFRRTVEISADTLSAPSAAQDTNIFGEQTAPSSSAEAPLVVYTDPLGLFGGTDGFIGLFTRFEQSKATVGGTERVAAAGRDPQRPAFVAYRLGDGLVVRVGTPEWGASLREGDPEVASITENLWSQLSE